MKPLLALIACCLMLAACGNGEDGASSGKTSMKSVFAAAGTVTKAKVFLGEGGDAYVVGNSGTTLYGNTGYDIVTIADGIADVNLDQNVEQINFKAPPTGYTFKQTGNLINVYDSAALTLLVKVPVQDDGDGTVLGFSGSVTASARLLAGGLMTLGGITVSTGTPTTIITDVSPTTSTTTSTTSATTSTTAASTTTTTSSTPTTTVPSGSVTVKW